MKPVGKPDALIGHVRFDERGWETGRRLSVSARAHPRLYLESWSGSHVYVAYHSRRYRRSASDATRWQDARLCRRLMAVRINRRDLSLAAVPFGIVNMMHEGSCEAAGYHSVPLSLCQASLATDIQWLSQINSATRLNRI